MKANVGKVDRAVRIIAGLGILGVGYYFQSPWGFLGLVPLATGFIRWCPAYIPFRLSTCEKEPVAKN